MRDLDLQTDTHLAKRYNDVLYDAIMRCNIANVSLEGAPHYDRLKVYYATVQNLFNNSFFLFNTIKVGKEPKKSLMAVLINEMEETKKAMKTMKSNIKLQTDVSFEEVSERCNKIQRYIMYGLQKRKMLVRMSEHETHGQDTISQWENKTLFSKGGLSYKRLGDAN
jgi:hypothetical protein